MNARAVDLDQILDAQFTVKGTRDYAVKCLVHPPMNLQRATVRIQVGPTFEVRELSHLFDEAPSNARVLPFVVSVEAWELVFGRVWGNAFVDARQVRLAEFCQRDLQGLPHQEPVADLLHLLHIDRLMEKAGVLRFDCPVMPVTHSVAKKFRIEIALHLEAFIDVAEHGNDQSFAFAEVLRLRGISESAIDQLSN